MNYRALWIIFLVIAVILEVYRKRAAYKKKQAELAAGTYKEPHRWFFASFLLAIIALLLFALVGAFVKG